MVGVTFWGNVDLASVSIWLFWIFFAFLIFYIQRENQREGYPLETEEGGPGSNVSLVPQPEPKTFKLPHGRGEVQMPSVANEEAHRRTDLAMEPMSKATGSAYMPTGDPMVDGIGAAAWTPRRDEPELDGHGHVKIRPLSTLPDFKISAGRDPRGLAVQAGDKGVIGRITDMLVDIPEAMVRFLVVDVNPEGSGKTRLIPIHFAKIKSDRVYVNDLYAKHFDSIPQTKAADQITLLEEEKISAYFGGGSLYADPTRTESQI